MEKIQERKRKNEMVMDVNLLRSLHEQNRIKALTDSEPGESTR